MRSCLVAPPTVHHFGLCLQTHQWRAIIYKAVSTFFFSHLQRAEALKKSPRLISSRSWGDAEWQGGSALDLRLLSDSFACQCINAGRLAFSHHSVYKGGIRLGNGLVLLHSVPAMLPLDWVVHLWQENRCWNQFSRSKNLVDVWLRKTNSMRWILTAIPLDTAVIPISSNAVKRTASFMLKKTFPRLCYPNSLNVQQGGG